MTAPRVVVHGLRCLGGFCCVAIGALLLAACGAVMDSSRIDPILALGDAEPTVLCKSDLGSYALPKAFLHVQVQRADRDSAPEIVQIASSGTVNTSSPVEVRRHPDRSLVFCLDYLSSALSHDVIKVKKWPIDKAATDRRSSFLGAVLVNAQDRTVFVIEALLRALFIAVSGDPDFLPRKGDVAAVEMLADLEYDPFDPRESAEVNTRLSRLGYCLVLEGFTFDRSQSGLDNYCNSPRSHATWSTPILKAYAKVEAEPANPLLPGLLYRPRVPYRLFVYRKLDPGGRERWKLSQTQHVALENLSPVLSLDVRRAAFAGRNANFVFDSGTLITACVAKKSEIEGFVDIPLQIARSLVALPAVIAKVQIDQTNSQRKLVEAENQLMQVQQAYMAALKGGQFTPVSGADQAGTLPQPTKLEVPSDLTNSNSIANTISTAPAYGTDLFGVQLDSICKGGLQ